MRTKRKIIILFLTAIISLSITMVTEDSKQGVSKTGSPDLKLSSMVQTISDDNNDTVQNKIKENISDSVNTTRTYSTRSINSYGSINENLNVRINYGMTKIIDSIKKGTKVFVTDEVEGWYKIKYSSKTGWAYSKFITLIKSEAKYGYVNVSSLNVRESCGYTKVIDNLKLNKKVEVLNEKNGWLNVSYDKKKGWVFKKYISLTVIPETLNKTGYASASSLNVRSTAGFTKILFTISYGKKLTVVRASGDWYYVKVDGKYGYVYKKYISFKAPVEQNVSGKRSTIVSYAKRYIGGDYVWGGTTPNGFDCSGLSQYCYKKVGISIPRTAKAQSVSGKSISKKNIKPGDLLFFTTNGTGSVSHVGIYVGDNKMVHASSPKNGIKLSVITSNYYVTHYICARNYVD